MLGRLKFELEELVLEMVSHLPVELFESKTTTFLDPCMGGGQFIAVIRDELRKYGHSDDNIASRIYGYEDNQFRINYAVTKSKLIGQFKVGGIQELEELNMKFDCVIGNPPYQSGNGEKGGRHSLWRKLVAKSFTLAADNGYVAMVCPGFPITANDMSHHFTENTPIWLVNDVTHHFNVGSKIKTWIVRKGKHQSPFYVDGVEWEGQISSENDPNYDRRMMSILAKISSTETFTCVQDGGYNSTQFKNDPNDYFAEPTDTAKYPIRHASTQKICYVTKPTDGHFKSKVVMTFSGYPDFRYYGSDNPISSCLQMSGYILVKDSDEGESLIQLYNSKLYRALANRFGYGAGMRGVKEYSLPKLDLTRTWTDEEIYEYFGLTQEEIDYIEDSI